MIPRNRMTLAMLAATMVVVGAAVSSLTTAFLFPWWMSLNWRHPVAQALIDSGHGCVAGSWTMFHNHFPGYFVALFIGIGIGSVSGSRPQVIAAACSSGMLLQESAPLLLAGTYPQKLQLFWFLFPWNMLIIPTMLIATWVATRNRGRTSASSRPA